jgi:hypothetical protein
MTDHFYGFAQPSIADHQHIGPLPCALVLLARVGRRNQMRAAALAHLARKLAAIRLHQMANLGSLGSRETGDGDFLE